MEKVTGQYLKFMIDIIDSGLWGQLSPSARTLYPVLLKFSDQNFKSVWPSTHTLLNLTGFKSKKSIIEAKKELSMKGLLYFKPGSGRTNSVYYFNFNYREVSHFTPQRGTGLPRTSILTESPESTSSISQSNISQPPNHINITINNNPNISNKEDLKIVFGEKIYTKSLENLVKKNVPVTYEELNKECLKLCNDAELNQDSAQHVIDSWKKFLVWAANFLTKSSSNFFESLKIQVDGTNIYIEEVLTDFQKQIIEKYFEENINPKIFILFNNKQYNV